MASRTHLLSSRKNDQAGLAHFMHRVLKESTRAARRFDEDSVHDLRVALRRSRTIADGLASFDPDKSLRAVKKASRDLFRSLGVLRDIQIKLEWLEKLAPEDDSLKSRLRETLAREEELAKAAASAALADFDVRRWRKWSRTLPGASRRVAPGSVVFEHLALARWIEAREAHRRAVRSRSRIAWHRVRIALKRFRYTVENFLPQRYTEWADGLKNVQDSLGAVHDLDVLWVTLRKLSAGADPAELEFWRGCIAAARAANLSAYRARTFGRQSLWNVWRAGLPDGERLEQASLATLAAWASHLDPDFDHSRRVAALALELNDGFRTAALHETFRDVRARRLLEAAALLHDVGRARKESGHHKISCRMIRKRTPPIGWTSDDMLWTALIARYHRGGDPRPEHGGYSSLLPAERQSITWLGATLRLADGLDADHKGRVTHVSVESTRPLVMLRAEGYVHDVESAAVLAKKKHLLETLCARAIIVRPAEEISARTIATLAS
ncbi:MAG: CHAD domain-containing protein [Candidatus Acidiferrales bacterium]